MGFGSGMTCWRRLRDRQAAKVFERLHRALLDRLGRANAVDFARCCSTARACRPKGGRVHRPEPDRGKPGSKRHVLVDAGGVPLALLLTAANMHDSRLFEPLLDILLGFHLLAAALICAGFIRRWSCRAL